jgi:hypothetical protein
MTEPTDESAPRPRPTAEEVADEVGAGLLICRELSSFLAIVCGDDPEDEPDEPAAP